MVHDGFDLADGSQVLLLGLLDDFHRRLSQDLLADDVLFALVVVRRQVLGDEFVFDLQVLGQ